MLGARPRIVFVHGSVMGGRPDVERSAALGDRFRARDPRPSRVPAEPPRRPRRLRGARRLRRRRDPRRRPPRRSLVRRRDRAPDGCRRAGPRAVADRDRAAGDRRRPRRSRRPMTFAREGIAVVAGRARPTIRRRSSAGSSATSAPTTIPRRRCRRSSSRASWTLIAERGPWEAEIPARHPRPDAVPQARRLRRPSRRLRRRVRRARRAAGRRSPRPARATATRAQRHPDFNERLAEFVRLAESRATA